MMCIIYSTNESAKWFQIDDDDLDDDLDNKDDNLDDDDDLDDLDDDDDDDEKHVGMRIYRDGRHFKTMR